MWFQWRFQRNLPRPKPGHRRSFRVGISNIPTPWRSSNWISTFLASERGGTFRPPGGLFKSTSERWSPKRRFFFYFLIGFRPFWVPSVGGALLDSPGPPQIGPRAVHPHEMRVFDDFLSKILTNAVNLVLQLSYKSCSFLITFCTFVIFWYLFHFWGRF